MSTAPKPAPHNMKPKGLHHIAFASRDTQAIHEQVDIYAGAKFLRERAAKSYPDVQKVMDEVILWIRQRFE